MGLFGADPLVRAVQGVYRNIGKMQTPVNYVGKVAVKATKAGAKAADTVGRTLVKHPKATVIGLGIGGLATYNAKPTVNKYMTHVDPNSRSTNTGPLSGIRYVNTRQRSRVAGQNMLY